MNSPQFVRWGGIAAIIAGIAGAVGSFEFVGGSWLYMVTNITTLIALLGIYLFQRDRAGLLGTLGVLVAAVGGLLLTFDISFDIAGMIYALGIILMAIAWLRSNIFARWIPWVWIVAVVIGVPGFLVPDLMTLSLQIGAILFAVGFVGIGLALWRTA